MTSNSNIRGCDWSGIAKYFARRAHFILESNCMESLSMLVEEVVRPRQCPVVHGTKIVPGRRRRGHRANVFGGFCHNYRKAKIQIPIDVAAQKSRAGLVGPEADRDLVVCSTDIHHVAADRILVIVGCAPRAA